MTCLFGTLDIDLQTRVRQFTTPQLRDLREALLDFSSCADLVAWLQKHGNQGKCNYFFAYSRCQWIGSF
ncbi:DUF4351 domain-containing protein [Iningainema tapete]|uniref:DUF4351 domain-containing protein n=1 Tax=Iningainema tapete TaxID=2806730 RepID=UPI00192DB477|nr:DUF4351 domain-containing protein [Iningainema tapete]